VVESILDRFGHRAARYRYLLRDRVRTNGTGPYFTLHDFHAEFTGRGFQVPLFLFSRFWSGSDKLLPMHLLDENFEKSKIAQEFITLVDELPPDSKQEYGMVFFWPRLSRRKTKRGGAVLLHNSGSPYSSAGACTRTYLDGAELWLEPLARVLDAWEASGVFEQDLNK
jgi:hypothetical protein